MSLHESQAPRLRPKKILNTTQWDIALSDKLRGGRILARHRRSMEIPQPTYLPPVTIAYQESHLVEFFRDSRSLVMGPSDEEALTNFIMRVAFSRPVDSSNGVMQAVFGLSSLQLHGASRSFRYKCLVLSSVQDPASHGDERQLLQDLVSLMLLYHYEMSLDSSSKGSWVAFFCAVKRIINTSPTFQRLIQQEYSVFLDWVFYHEALAEFTVRHWAVPYVGCGFAPVPRSLRSFDDSNADIGCPVSVLELLVGSCRQAIVAAPLEKELVIHAGDVGYLESTVAQAVGAHYFIGVPEPAPQDRRAMVSDLHRLASLIYANRAVHHVSRLDIQHNRLVRSGISLLTRMGTCQHAWALFIVSCEAETDVERSAILEILEQSRQERRRRSNHIHFIQHLVESVWNQKDLDVDNEISYLSILDAVIGGVPFMPLFV